MWELYGKQYQNLQLLRSGDWDQQVYIQKKQLLSAYTVGILIQDVYYPLLSGNVVNADTYAYPVQMEIVPSAN